MSLQGNNILIYANNPNSNGSTLAGGTAGGTLGVDTNGTTIYTAGTNGSRVFSIFLSSTYIESLGVFVYILNGTNVYPLASINIPGNSGNNAGAACVDGIAPTVVGMPLDMTGRPYIELAPNSVLKISGTSGIPVGTMIYANTIASDY